MPENEVPFQRLRAAIVKLARVARNDRAHAAGSSYVAESSRSRTNDAFSMNPHCVRDGVSRSATTRACSDSGAVGSTSPRQLRRGPHGEGSGWLGWGKPLSGWDKGREPDLFLN